jgi:hypothetical protein
MRIELVINGGERGKQKRGDWRGHGFRGLNLEYLNFSSSEQKERTDSYELSSTCMAVKLLVSKLSISATASILSRSRTAPTTWYLPPAKASVCVCFGGQLCNSRQTCSDACMWRRIRLARECGVGMHALSGSEQSSGCLAAQAGGGASDDDQLLATKFLIDLALRHGVANVGHLPVRQQIVRTHRGGQEQS